MAYITHIGGGTGAGAGAYRLHCIIEGCDKKPSWALKFKDPLYCALKLMKTNISFVI
jgi:hypothetical protein